MIAFLISIVVVAVIVYIVSLIIGWLAIPEPIRTIVWLVFALIVLLYLLQMFGIYNFR